MTDAAEEGVGATKRKGRSAPARFASLLAIALVAFYMIAAVYLSAIQRKLLFFPAGYEPVWRNGVPAETAELVSTTPNGERMVAFYVPPAGAGDGPPDRVWVLFHGNAARALDWVDNVEAWRDERTGFLLVDYPGYGLCEGKPTRSGVIEAAELAWSAFGAHVGSAPGEMKTELNVLGFSLGAAAALEFASRHPAKRVVLLAPFTSVRAMGSRMVTPLLSWLVVDRFDNADRLDDLAASEAPPAVHVFHAKDDEIVPYAMGESLAKRHPGMIRFHPVETGGHNWLLGMVEDDLRHLVRGEE